MPDIDISRIEQIIRQVAEKEVLPRFKNLQQGDVREKNPGDLVTVADEAAEAFLSEKLTEALPGSIVVGEEAVSKDKSVLERLKGNDPVWVIDPIDGTYNFAHGRSTFGILVALVHKGITRYGFAYDVIGERMATAKKGGGAYINGQKISLAPKTYGLKEMTGQGGGAQAWHFKPVLDDFKEIINYRCSLHDFMNFATGRSDFIIHVNKLTPWDHAAGCLIAEEVGGYVMKNDGERYDPSYFGPGFMVVASSPENCRRIYDVAYSKLTKSP